MIPSCVVKAIRAHFPESSNIHVGFKDVAGFPDEQNELYNFTLTNQLLKF